MSARADPFAEAAAACWSDATLGAGLLAIDPVGPTGYGFSDERKGGRQPVRDGPGREIGTVEPWLSGQLILRDAAGRRVDTLHSIGNGRYLVGDRLDSGIPTLDLR